MFNPAGPVYSQIIASPLGNLLLAATPKGLCGIYFEGRFPRLMVESAIESGDHLTPFREQLEAYFRGQLKTFTVPLDLSGTGFQKRCWEALATIPYGALASYAMIARAVGSPRAFRAVGQANHNNPVPIVIPCHRVVGSDGKLTGYGGGLHIKQKLLEIEGISSQAMLSFPATHAGSNERKGRPGADRPPLA